MAFFGSRAGPHVGDGGVGSGGLECPFLPRRSSQAGGYRMIELNVCVVAIRQGLGVFARRAADEFLEVVGEMRLIEVAQILRKRRPSRLCSDTHALQRFVYPIALDHPARAGTDISVEKPLQRPFVD